MASDGQPSGARATGRGSRLPALEGIRVVDVTQVLAGPTAARTLAEFGAEVIKVNNPSEEGAGYRWQVHRYHTDVNRGKRTILLDLKTPDGREISGRLIERADVVLQNFRLGVAERLGIGYEQISARRRTSYTAPSASTATAARGSAGRGTSPMPRRPRAWPRASAVRTARRDHSPSRPTIMRPACWARSRSAWPSSIDSGPARASTWRRRWPPPRRSCSRVFQSHDGKAWDEPSGPGALGWSPLQRLYRAADGWLFLGATESQHERLEALDGRVAGRSPSDAPSRALATRPATSGRAPGRGGNRRPALVPAAGHAGPLGRRPRSQRHARPRRWRRDHHDRPPRRVSRTPVVPGRPRHAGRRRREILRDRDGRRLHELVERVRSRSSSSPQPRVSSPDRLDEAAGDWPRERQSLSIGTRQRVHEMSVGASRPRSGGASLASV